MTCHITMQRIPPPAPLAPPALNAAQMAFLALHAASQPPHTWRWHFAGSALRATGEAGSATIWADDLDALVEAGHLRRGVGCADCHVTMAGRDAVAAHEPVITG
jgi:hypothetical protein